MSTTLVDINGLTIEIESSYIDRIPYLARLRINNIVEIITSYTYDKHEIMLFFELVDGYTDNFKHIRSYRTLYGILRFAKETYSLGEILGYFDEWPLIEQAHYLNAHKYVYAIYYISSSVINMKEYIVTSGYYAVSSMIKLAKKLDINMYIEACEFFSNLNIPTCFNGYDNNIKYSIKSIEEKRNSIGNNMLINPYDIPNEFTYRRTTCESWSASGITKFTPYEYGQNVLADKETLDKNLYEFTYGILTNNQILFDEPREMLPLDNIVIAGGSITKLLDANYSGNRTSDLDIFIIADTNELREKVFHQLLKWFESPNTYYAINGSVVSIYIKNITRKFQIICTNDAETPFNIINRFDLTHICWCWYNGNFLGSASAVHSLRTRTTKCHNICRLRTDRLLKALHNGYNIVKDERIDGELAPFIQVDEYGNFPITLKKKLREFYGFWYPTTTDMPAEEELEYILYHIEKDSKALICTNEASVVSTNYIIGGNFDSEYISTLFSLFNPMIITNTYKSKTHVPMCCTNGIIQLSTDKMRITRLSANEPAYIVVDGLSNQFKEFCRLMDTTVYHIFKITDVVSGLVCNDELIWGIPKHSVARAGFIRSAESNHLTFADIAPGDIISITFTVQMILKPGCEKVEFRPVRIIKHI